MKTSELTGAALDWAVCKAAGLIDAYPSHQKPAFFLKAWRAQDTGPLHPSTDWANGGPIIERDGICLLAPNTGDFWDARSRLYPPLYHRGPTPLIAAMRCYVASKLGDEIDIPKELLP